MDERKPFCRLLLQYKYYLIEMINIYEYLLSKNKTCSGGFPKNPDPDNIIEFLTSHGFEEIDRQESSTYLQIGKKIYNAKKPVFIKGSYSSKNRWTHSIMFGDSSETSKEVRIFFVRTNEELIRAKVNSCFMYWNFTDKSDNKMMGESTATKFESYEDIVEAINEYYEW